MTRFDEIRIRQIKIDNNASYRRLRIYTFFYMIFVGVQTLMFAYVLRTTMEYYQAQSGFFGIWLLICALNLVTMYLIVSTLSMMYDQFRQIKYVNHLLRIIERGNINGKN